MAMAKLQTRKVYGRRGDLYDIDRSRLQSLANREQRPCVLVDETVGKGRVLRRVRPVYRTIGDIATRNTVAGYCWFTPDTLKFFGSRVSEQIYPASDGRAYFVTSERDNYGRYGAWGGVRRYSVRVANVDGSIDTVGEFGEYSTGRAAHRAAREFSEDVRANRTR